MAIKWNKKMVIERFQQAMQQSQNPMQQKPDIQQVISQIKGVRKVK